MFAGPATSAILAESPSAAIGTLARRRGSGTRSTIAILVLLLGARVKLTVVTLVTRPGNLPAIADSINAALVDGFGQPIPGLDVRWLVLFDQAKLPAPELVVLPAQSPDTTEGYCVEVLDGQCGEPFLRNKALDLVDVGHHIAWCDDDNLVEPDFFLAVAAQLAEQPGAVLVFDQVLADGTHRLTASPDNMRFGSVDTAQVVAPREVYGAHRFDNVANGTDGFMYERLWQSHGTRFKFVNEPRVKYNALHR